MPKIEATAHSAITGEHADYGTVWKAFTEVENMWGCLGAFVEGVGDE